MMDEPTHEEENLPPLDASVVVSVALAELEVLRAETSIAMSQREVVSAEPPGVHDLSPLGKRPL
jgi:hypothetical protein